MNNPKYLINCFLEIIPSLRCLAPLAFPFLYAFLIHPHCKEGTSSKRRPSTTASTRWGQWPSLAWKQCNKSYIFLLLICSTSAFACITGLYRVFATCYWEQAGEEGLVHGSSNSLVVSGWHWFWYTRGHNTCANTLILAYLKVQASVVIKHMFSSLLRWRKYAISVFLKRQW